MNIEKHLRMLRLNGMEQHWKAMKETKQGTLPKMASLQIDLIKTN